MLFLNEQSFFPKSVKKQNHLFKILSLFQWFDLTCGPKLVPDFAPSEKWPRLDPAPVVTWEDGKTYKMNVYPLCGVLLD